MTSIPITNPEALPLDALIAYLRRHGATPRASLQALVDWDELSPAQAHTIARRLAAAIGSPIVPIVKRGAA